MNLTKIDSALFKKMIVSGANNLSLNKDLIDELNVFPVPDGDTGTNMSLTVLAASNEAIKEDSASIKTIAKRASNGALRGARGNSGVILSQLFRGFAKGLDDKAMIDLFDLAEAADLAVKTAYKAVMKPKEGTILTVAREIAEKAKEMAVVTDDIEYFFSEIIEHANFTLSMTTEMLDALKQANVVDAGGKGLVCIIEGAYNAIVGKENIAIEDRAVKDYQFLPEASDFKYDGDVDIEFGYCTELFINLEKANPDLEEELKNLLIEKGDSIVLVNDDTLVKVHVHTNNPGEIIEKALSYGYLSDIKIDNMRLQHQHIIEEADNIIEEKKLEKPEEYKDTCIIAIASGDGLAKIFESLGVDKVIAGGQSMNPSTEDIVEAMNSLNCANVIILPNNKNIILAAQQAVYMTEDKIARVVGTETIPQGINAMISYDMSADFADNLDLMRNSLGDIKSASITYAVRDSKFEDKDIKEGDLLGLAESNIAVVANSLERTLLELLEKIVEDDDEIITLYYGEEVSLENVNILAAEVSIKYPDIEIAVHEGNQAIYYLIISVE